MTEGMISLKEPAPVAQHSGTRHGAEARVKHRGKERSSRISRNPRLLVVDDDDSVRESLRKLLETEHYRVHPVCDGAEALRYFGSNPVDLVVLDLNLPRRDGWEVFHAMSELNPFVPTVIITAEIGQRERAVAAGVDALVEKPIDVPAFLDIIRDLLAETQEERFKRICGQEHYCRYVPRYSQVVIDSLQERYSTPLQLTPALEAVLSTASNDHRARRRLGGNSDPAESGSPRAARNERPA